jgi:lyso-ornithine lipid O-acyltransferase
VTEITDPPLSTGRWRAAATLSGFALLTVPLMPLQALLLQVNPRLARRLPHWYHRQVCRLLGIKLHIHGAVVRDRAVLVVANHSTWLDIPVLSAVAPVSFIAKKEVAGWPFVSQLARLQRTVFVDRTRRTAVGATTHEMVARLSAGDALVLFAEGTSTDGTKVLPLRTSLFGAVMPAAADSASATVVVQTCAVVYGHLHGLPIDRAARPRIGWYGDMAMGRHAWDLLKAGPIDVSIVIGPPVSMQAFANRKALAAHTETELRQTVARLLRYRPLNEAITVVEPAHASRTVPTGASTKWQ